MFWCINANSSKFAVRIGDWKLMRTGIAEGLFNLAEDPTETTDLSAQRPDKVKELLAEYNKWQTANPKPLLTKEMRQKVNDISNQLENEHPELSITHTFGPKYK
jgi:arylsulfatase A-like enzyme